MIKASKGKTPERLPRKNFKREVWRIMASMSYCRWQNIREDLRDAMEDYNNDKSLSEEEKTAMKDCIEMFVYLLQVSGISEQGYDEVDLALINLYTKLDERCENDDD